MSKLKLHIAVFFSKLTYFVFRLLGRNASHSPGVVALFLCKDYLNLIPKSPLTICVSGTNGKTTVTNMISDVLNDNGYTVSTNRLGSNIVPGIATALTNSVTLWGKPKVEAVVLEVDERASRLILPFVKPDFMVVTGLFRDSLKRNAHPDYIFDILNTYTPDGTKMILNADELCSSMLKENSPRTYFGIGKQPEDLTESINLVADYSICPKCHTLLKYNYLHYHHIGNACCPSCGFESHKADYPLETIDRENKTLSIKKDGKLLSFPLVNDAIFNVYNELTVITTLSEAGLATDKIADSLAKLSVVKTRLNKTTVGNITVVRTMSKGQSCVSCSRTFELIRAQPGKKAVILVVDDMYDRKDSVEYIGWIYDSDFEFLCDENILQVIASGPRCYDHKVRLLMAGVDKEKIYCDTDEMKAIEGLKLKGIDRLYVLYDTSTYNLAQKVADKAVKIITEAQAK